MRPSSPNCSWPDLRHLAFTDGNQIKLLHSGAGFYPALISAIDAARVEIYLETYIFPSMRRECWSAKPSKGLLDAVLWSMSSMTGSARAAKILTNCA
jgi:phosphatidylserine/phosphatidylglycerophosphate/cardiolipin synthase-like enzyme